jgi:hypothetical protein
MYHRREHLCRRRHDQPTHQPRALCVKTPDSRVTVSPEARTRLQTLAKCSMQVDPARIGTPPSQLRATRRSSCRLSTLTCVCATYFRSAIRRCRSRRISAIRPRQHTNSFNGRDRDYYPNKFRCRLERGTCETPEACTPWYCIQFIDPGSFSTTNLIPGKNESA